MRSIIFSLTLAAGIAAAADGPESVTYLKGDAEGFSINESATLTLPDTKVMVLKNKGASLEIPYGAVVSTERKEVPVLSEPEPLYKVWTLRKKLMPPAPLEELTVAYRTKTGAQQTVTIELEKSFASKVMKWVDAAAARNASNDGAWWGDDVWKTKRNKDQWGGAGTVAQRE